MLTERITLRVGDTTFRLIVSGKYNFVVGGSGEGKTLLGTRLRNIENRVLYSYNGFLPLRRFSSVFVEASRGETVQPCVVYLDEDEVKRYAAEQIYSILKRKGICSIISTRVLPKDIPFGVYNLFKFVRKKKDIQMEQLYTPNQFSDVRVTKGTIVTEDSRAGYETITRVFEPMGFFVHSSLGKGNILGLVQTHKGRMLYLAVDMCDFGYEITSVLREITEREDVFILDNASFEFQVLGASFFKGQALTLRSPSIKFLLEFPSEEAYYTECVNALSKKLFSESYKKV